MNFKEKIIEVEECTSNEQKRSIHFKSLKNFIFY